MIENVKSYYGKDNVRNVSNYEDVYRCENKDENLNTYQIIYLHQTDDWVNINYNDFIEELILEDYYKQEGFLQWNFYFYVITSENSIKSNLFLKSSLENNDNYCRKSVLSENDFIDLLKSYSDISKISNNVNVDLYSLWVNKLREEELFFVFNDVNYPNYKKPVEEYLEGKTFKDFEKIPKSNMIEELQINSLKELNLIEFRNFPLKKEYSLEAVNLIFGPNAVGKTSFFDAIELTITGSVNSKDANLDYKLLLTDINSHAYEYPSKKSEIYKSRDISWYSSGLNRGNRLNANFNKFNYFSSDAAFLLKKDEDDKNSENLERVMSDIALGRDVNKLEERIKSFKDKFEDKLKEFKKYRLILVDNLNEKEIFLKELDNRNKAFLRYRTLLENSLITNNWEKKYDFEQDGFVIELDAELQTVQTYITQIKKNENVTLKSLSVKFINDEILTLKSSLKYVEDLSKNINEKNNKKKEYNNLQRRFNVLLDYIEELKRYFLNEYFKHLLTIDEVLKTKTLEINENNNILNLSQSVFNDVDFLLEFDDDKMLFDIEKELFENKEFNTEKQSELNNQISQFEKNIEELSIIISNIKSSGKTFIIKNPNSNSCPLCSTPFEHSDLEKAILNTKNSFANSEMLISYKNSLNSTNNILRNINQNIVSLGNFKKLYFAIYKKDDYKKSIKNIRVDCKIIQDKRAYLDNELLKLSSIKSTFINQNLSAIGYRDIINSIKSDYSIDIKDNEELTDFKLKILNEIEETNAFTILNDLSINELEKELLNHNIFKVYKNNDEIAKSINNLLDIQYSLTEIEKYINVKNTSNILGISECVNNISSAFTNYHKAYLLMREVSSDDIIINEDIAKINEDIVQTKLKEKKGINALKILDSLLNENGKDVFLNNYIDSNKNEITSIFKMIHSPKEFTDINFKNGKINLSDNNGNLRSLSQISTGQRSALALSIFLSLNKKLKNGPDIIMFDDPVTYIDDLNVLTFFDYLREIVLKTKRQVFFATANEDLAFLFEKKFEFLGANFIKHKLDRLAN